jgi:SAM-dependent methyltransferase
MHDDEYRAMFDLEERLWWFAGMRAVTASILETGRERTESPRLLDIGCGTGFSLLWLKEKLNSDQAFGVDVSQHAAALWPLRQLDTCAVASADGLPFASGEFDLVTCFDVIYQLEADQARAAVGEMHRVLRPGGWLFIREPAYDWMRGGHDIAVGTRHRYTRTELRCLLLSQGFLLERATYVNTLLFWAAVPYRLLSRIKGSEESDVKPVPRFVNEMLTAALKLEARLLRLLTFPFGLSVAALAEKKR